MDMYMLLVVSAALVILVAGGVKLLDTSLFRDEDEEVQSDAGQSDDDAAGSERGAISLDHPAGTAFTHADEREYRVEIVVQLLFVHLRLDGIFIDTIVLEALGVADGAIEVGSPLSLRLERPQHEAMGLCAEALLELWADRSEILTLEICVRGQQVRAELSNGANRVVLDISEGAGLP